MRFLRIQAKGLLLFALQTMARRAILNPKGSVTKADFFLFLVLFLFLYCAESKEREKVHIRNKDIQLFF